MAKKFMKEIQYRRIWHSLLALVIFAFALTAISCAGRNAEKELIAACENGDLERVKEIIEQFPHLVNLKYVEHHRGEVEGMKYDYHSETTPLIKATQRGHKEMVRFLCTKGADPNMPIRSKYKVEIDEIEGFEKGEEGPLMYPVQFAVSIGQSDSLDILIQNDAKINIENDYLGILDMAIFLTGNKSNWMDDDKSMKRDPIGVLRLLLDSNISMQKAEFGNTPAHQCVSSGSVEALKMLVDKGASISEYNEFDMTPLGLARFMKKQDMVKFLESIGAPE